MRANVEVLEYLRDNDQWIVDQVSGTTFEAVLGVVKRLIATDGDVSALVGGQQGVYQHNIKPLLEPRCEGVVGPDDETGESLCPAGATIEDELVLTCYQEETFLCGSCRHDAAKWAADKS